MFDINSLLAQSPPLPLGLNLLDIIIIIAILFYAHEGYVLGFVLAAFDLASFILSFIIALKFYTLVAQLLMNAFSMPIGLANAAAFFLTAFLSEIILNLFFRRLTHYLPVLHPSYWLYRVFKKTDRVLGILPGIISAFIVLSFLFSVIVSLPSSPLIKSLVTGSQIGSQLIVHTSLFEKQLNTIFGGALNETLNFLTVEPKTDELVKLNFTTANGTINEEAEQAMWKMVNTERVKHGLPPLAFDNELRDVGRAHSQDMLTRGYFSHYTPDGVSPFDRMNAVGIEYLAAGENLALAPSTELAMMGLMNSLGHRDNILNPDFGKIGIGAIDGGIYGVMFSQEFTN